MKYFSFILLMFVSLNVSAQNLQYSLQDVEITISENANVSSKADCFAGQTVSPGESCTYPDTSAEFEVNSSGSAKFTAGGFTSSSGPGGSINVNNFTINGVKYNFVAKGNSNGSWFLEQVASDTADPGPTEDITVIYDSGQNDDNIFLEVGEVGIMAQRYDVPSGTILTSVMVAPVYDNQFTGSTVSADAPRDFTVKVWDVAADGFPGDELYSMDVDESPSASHVDNDLKYLFLQVDFPANEDIFATLPEQIFIGLTNKGSDGNYLVAGTSRRADTAPDDAAHLYVTIQSTTQWAALADLELSNGESLASQVHPIRPHFTVPVDVSVAGPVELPSNVTLLQNFPNPFNPSTTIAYTLDRSGPVEVTVYDLTGRIIETLVEGVQSAGNHEVRFDADDLPAGTYLYRLLVGTETLTQTMTLVR